MLFFVPGTVLLSQKPSKSFVIKVASIAASSKTSRVRKSRACRCAGRRDAQGGPLHLDTKRLGGIANQSDVVYAGALTDAAARLAGGADRAELRLVP